jgi:ring-1,2-phenylacetyl-CoA epoxidase subunit PaaD
MVSPAPAGRGADERARLTAARTAAAGVADPELPGLTLGDLGILREVRPGPDGVEVVITPTYTGCPALETISRDVVRAVEASGAGPATVRVQLAPAWSTDDITATGRARLAAAGIAPPAPVRGPVPVALAVRCPRCGSADTTLVSAFGSTACLALRRCAGCAEPFPHVKPL